ncbi:rhomboid family intramembrane serine protease GlpG [Pseudoalteromonas aurantia]|uniref:GlpG protein n=1 Tax=Pseudoalteromonas aurantia 208 TaxID=1314867 RepID=A0ABR9E7Y3_9GAMM|nr:rhomboid family intramembrane serine protease GlpG [Pseudoalteromonas aurantia]MBE0367094.1 GlpG protein [Pseudoalteromonas aurantia 208]
MILIGTSDNPRAVQGAADYFKSQGVAVVLESHDGRYVQVWVPKAQHEQAQALWQDFIDNPYDEKYLTASWHTGDTDTQFMYKGGSLNLIRRFHQLHCCLKSVFVVCIAIFISFHIFDTHFVFQLLQFDPSSPMTWLSPALIHIGIVHLVFNLGWWLHLGDKLINRVGPLQVVSISIASAIISNWAQYLFVDQNFGGLSGVVYALLGYAWIYSQRNPSQAALVEKPVVGFMLIWMALGFTDLLFVNMANWAHLFGMLTGMLLAILFNINKNEVTNDKDI